jgi:hypothetical protein
MGSKPKQQAVPDPIPPVTQTSRETLQAERDTQKQAAARKGFKTTLIAGEGNKFSDVSSAFGTKTLLGQ